MQRQSGRPRAHAKSLAGVGADHRAVTETGLRLRAVALCSALGTAGTRVW